MNTTEADTNLATQVGASSATEEPAASEDLRLTRLHNYVLLELLGRGGMGIVYAAYDEQLDRKVAIKLLRSVSTHRPRLLREAQAMARVTHPNVVSVYEIGEFEHTPFIAMEFVDGETLGEWRARAPRSRAELLAVFEAAGRGLAAAHDKGVIHRDFKPDNVMVSREGRVLVMDFGIARGEGEKDKTTQTDEQPDLADASASVLEVDLTATGVMVGTPAYMAPEQFRRAEIGAPSDQFSFCVALWEALYDQRPFQGRNFATIASAVLEGRIQAPERRDVPSWLRKVIERGLATEPAQRWPSMHELLDALARDPTRRRRWLVASGLGMGLLGLSWLGIDAWLAREQAAGIEACAAEGRALSSAWNPEIRSQLETTFVGAGDLASADLWVRTARRLDDYADEWATLRADTCVEAKITHTRDAASHARVSACLDERSAVFVALLETWSANEGFDPKALGRVPKAVADLPPLSLCTHEGWLAQRVPAPEDEATRVRVTELRTTLERVEALQLAARYQDALVLAREVLEAAEVIAWVPLQAEARFVIGDLQELLGDYPGAVETLEQALFEAGAVGDDLVALRAATKLTWTVGVRLVEFDEGLRWAKLGSMFVTRMQLEGTIHEAQLLNAIGAIHFRRSDFSRDDLDQALRAYQRALSIRETVLGPDHPLVAATHSNIGLVLWAQGNYEGALRAHRQAMAAREAAFGPEHPEVAASLSNISLVLTKQRAFDAALVAAREAHRILAQAFGPKHPSVGSALTNLGFLLEARGDYEDALVIDRQALALIREVLGPEHLAVAGALTNLGSVLAEIGEASEGQARSDAMQEARELLERALAFPDQDSRRADQRARNRFALAKVLWFQAGSEATPEARERALESAEAAIELFRECGVSERDALERAEAWLSAAKLGY